MNNDALTRWLTSPEGLSTRLRLERTRAGLSQQAIVDRAGWSSKSKVSKMESGQQMPTVEDVTAWAEACGIDPDPLLALRDEAVSDHSSWAKRLAGGQVSNQQAYLDLVRSSTSVWSLDRELIPGELQTKPYAREVLSQSIRMFGGADDTEAATEVRRERQNLLAMPAKRFEFLIGEAALRNLVVDAAEMAEQCDLIGRFAEFPSVDVGVLPLHARLETFPRAAFAGYDDTVVLEEGNIGERDFPRLGDVKLFRSLFDAYQQDAVHGTGAVALIEEIAGRHRASA